MSTCIVLDEAFLTVEAIGYDKTVEVLRKARYGEVVFSDKNIEFVVETVCKQIEVSVHEILHGNGRKNERKYAIGFCAYYLHYPQFFNLDMEVVKDYLNKDVSLCYKYSKSITKLNPNHISDKKFSDIKKFLDEAIEKYLKQNSKK